MPTRRPGNLSNKINDKKGNGEGGGLTTIAHTASNIHPGNVPAMGSEWIYPAFQTLDQTGELPLTSEQAQGIKEEAPTLMKQFREGTGALLKMIGVIRSSAEYHTALRQVQVEDAKATYQKKKADAGLAKTLLNLEPRYYALGKDLEFADSLRQPKKERIDQAFQARREKFDRAVS